MYSHFQKLENDIVKLEEKHKYKIDNLSQQFDSLLYSNIKSLKKCLYHQIQISSKQQKNIFNIRNILNLFFYLSIFFIFSQIFLNSDLSFKNQNISKKKIGTIKSQEIDNKLNESQVIQELRRDLNYTKHISLTGHTRIKSQEIDNTLNESQIIQELRRDLNNTKQICLTGHTNRVYSLIELKSGKIASASADNTIKIWYS